MENKSVESVHDWDKYQKISIIIGVLLFAFAVFNYLVLKPRAEKRAYEGCMVAIKETHDLLGANSFSEALNICAKSDGASEIMRKYNDREEERLAAKEKKDAENVLKKLSQKELNDVKIEISDYNEKSRTFSGKISNNNKFNINNIFVDFSFSSDKDGKNKINEATCFISETFYADSAKNFKNTCYALPRVNQDEWWYLYGIDSAERN